MARLHLWLKSEKVLPAGRHNRNIHSSSGAGLNPPSGDHHSIRAAVRAQSNYLENLAFSNPLGNGDLGPL